jgi:hypothetical protein
MKDNQHEQLFTELTAEFEPPAFTELDDEVAATCSGGAVTLYENGNFNIGDDGRVKVINGSTRNLGGFNDLTSSFKISSGRWEFYADEQYNQLLFTRGPGNYPVLRTGKNGSNDRITSIKKVG